MDARRILLLAVVAARKAGALVVPFFDRGLVKLLELAEKDLEAAKGGLKVVLGPMVGQAVLRRIDAAADAQALRKLADDFGFASYFEAGRQDKDITDALLDEALPAEAQAQLAPAEVVSWLVDDKSGWWREDGNVVHLAEVVEGVLEADQSLRGDLVTALDPEVVFQHMVESGDDNVKTKFVRFAAGLRVGAKNSAVFDGKLLAAFTVEELVRHTPTPDAVWDFCRDGLRVAVKPATPTEPLPPALVTCGACGNRYPAGTASCECGQALSAQAAAVG